MTSQSKVLCLADNTSDQAWGHKLAQDFANSRKITFRGTLSLDEGIKPGCYHIGPVSMQQKDIIDASKHFDRIVLLDQTQEQYSHSRIFLAMWKLVNDMAELGIKVDVMNSENMQYLYDWEEYFVKNKTFCIDPWVLMHDGLSGYTNLCGRNWKKIKPRKKIHDWSTDPEYSSIRKKMLAGKTVSGCEGCYKFEDKGIRDMRWTDSFDWITRLKIKSVDDLKKFKDPVYFEVRPSNKCNLMCRMCSPRWSHLIQDETKQIDDVKFQDIVQKFPDSEILNNSSFDKLNLDTLERVYIAGGEPTVMPEVYEFLRKCVKEDKTDFELNINTNAVKISEPLFDLFKQFKRLWFTCSIDGTPRTTEYVRWGTDSAKQIENIHRLKNNGAGIHFISVVSIYNVHEIGDTMAFFDDEFPYATIQLNRGAYKNDLLTAWNHPMKDKVLESILQAKKTRCYYHQERGSKPIIDALEQHYQSNQTFDRQKLKDFFYYNDTLDKKRGCKLIDYIPTLEECRKYIINH
jgi:MoaA/NifB/PqqE/SkfB family radical SAM enzyme